MAKKLGYLILTLMVCGLLAAPAWCAEQLTTTGADRAEVAFGDLTADALCGAAGTVLSFVPAVSFKPGNLPAAGATREQIAGLLQTPDESWAVCRLTGAQLRRALERSLSRLPLPSLAFLQVSGLTVNYNASKPREARVVTLTSSGGAIQAEKTYEVAMPLSLAEGGSGYFQVWDKDAIVRRGTGGLADVIFSFRQANPDRAYTGQGRIVASS